MMKFPEEFQIASGEDGGEFVIPHRLKNYATRKYLVVASNGMGWEHASIHIMQGRESLTPNWEDMCYIKNLFWEESDTVIQYHPAKNDYVNVHPNVLHLWRATEQAFPQPPKVCI
jgi:hypothetical protein